MEFHVKEIGLDEIERAMNVLNHIPEFDSVFYRKQLERRLKNRDSILLIAEFAGKPVACKIAYNRYFDGSIYSWLGGVLPPFREQGVAQLLQVRMEAMAKAKFYLQLRMKTRNKHVKMLRFALKNGFLISGFEAYSDPLDSRIELMKEL